MPLLQLYLFFCIIAYIIIDKQWLYMAAKKRASPKDDEALFYCRQFFIQFLGQLLRLRKEKISIPVIPTKATEAIDFNVSNSSPPLSPVLGGTITS